MGDRAKQPSALSRTLTRALNITFTTVIAGQVKHIRTTVEQRVCPAISTLASRCFFFVFLGSPSVWSEPPTGNTPTVLGNRRGIYPSGYIYNSRVLTGAISQTQAYLPTPCSGDGAASARPPAPGPPAARVGVAHRDCGGGRSAGRGRGCLQCNRLNVRTLLDVWTRS